MMALFEGGTPNEPGAARALYERALGEPNAALRWCVDAANIGLLSRAVRELDATTALEVVLPAHDEAPDRTVVADEGMLVPTLRRLREQRPEGLAFTMTNGRPYVLPPPALDISTNDLCGLKCIMCGNRASRRDPHTISVDDVRALVDEAAAWGIRRVALTGAGEPFRDPAMLEHVAYANARGHLVTITSNGFPISEKMAADLAQRNVSISMSIHGATEATHDAIVGVPTAAEHAWRAVRRLVRARDGRPDSKLRVNVSSVIQRDNLGEIPALVRRAREEGCNGINLQPVNLQHGFLKAGAIVRRDDIGAMSRLWPVDRAELDRVFEELSTLKPECGRFLHASLERLALLRRYFDDPSRDALGVTCRVGESFLAVDHRGQIKPCYRLPWSYGDARFQRLRPLWNSEAYARTRALVESCPLTCMNNCFFRKEAAS
ncbi:radical SAM protein [Pendulispora rubella]|uniref:Radical SAM protein n=1 Tax=Pendulispora rubella TaxID=2741070 RepID=A0ABZ2LBV1_9BACT